MLIVAAGVAVGASRTLSRHDLRLALITIYVDSHAATAGPSFFRMPVKSPQRAGVVLGTWTLTTYALVAHLSEKCVLLRRPPCLILRR